jgi:hypothetical protein
MRWRCELVSWDDRLIRGGVSRGGVSEQATCNLGPRNAVRDWCQSKPHVMVPLEPTSVEFVIAIPEEDVRIKVTHYHEVGIECRESTRSVVQDAAKLFVKWAHQKDFELSANGRRSIDLWVVEISAQLLNDHKASGRVSASTEQRPFKYLYDATAIKGTHIMYVGVDESRSSSFSSATVAHKLAYFLLFYFRIYNNYYKIKDGKYDFEGPACEFERYFWLNLLWVQRTSSPTAPSPPQPMGL